MQWIVNAVNEAYNDTCNRLMIEKNPCDHIRKKNTMILEYLVKGEANADIP